MHDDEEPWQKKKKKKKGILGCFWLQATKKTMHNRHTCTIGTKKSHPIADEIFYEIVVYFNLH